MGFIVFSLATEQRQVVMDDINEISPMKERSLAGWAWFFISFVVPGNSTSLSSLFGWLVGWLGVTAGQ